MSDSTHTDDGGQPDETQPSEERVGGEQSVDPLPLGQLAQIHHQMGIAGARLSDAHGNLAEAYRWREHETPVVNPSHTPREELLAALTEASDALEEAIQQVETARTGGDREDQGVPDNSEESPDDEMVWNRS